MHLGAAAPPHCAFIHRPVRLPSTCVECAQKHRPCTGLTILPKRIASEPAFPAWYADTYARRWRFATLRLAMEDAAPDPAFVELMGVRSAADRSAIAAIAQLPGRRARRLVALGWFWYRWRPYRLRDLFGTPISRCLQRWFGRSPS